MKKIIFYSLLFLLVINSCTTKNYCPSDKVEAYLNNFFDSMENILLLSYMNKEDYPDNTAENVIVAMSYQSDFEHLIKPPECAIPHYDQTFEVIDLLIDDIVDKHEDSTNTKIINEKLNTLFKLTEKLIYELEDEKIKEELNIRFQEVNTIQERSKEFFINHGLIEPSDKEKKEIILNFIDNDLDNDSQMILHEYIDYVRLDVINGDVIFFVDKEIYEDEVYEEIFKSLFFAGLVNSIDSDKNFIWDINSIGVVFNDKEGNWIDIYMEGNDFQEFFNNPENLFYIVRKQTSLD